MYVLDMSACRSQRVHMQDIDSGQPGKPHALTAADTQQRFADYILDADRNRLIAVCEDHSQQGQEPTNTIAAIGMCGHLWFREACAACIDSVTASAAAGCFVTTKSNDGSRSGQQVDVCMSDSFGNLLPLTLTCALSLQGRLVQSALSCAASLSQPQAQSV